MIIGLQKFFFIKNTHSFIVEQIDIEKSIEVINQVLAILQPKYICFISKKAYNNQ
jgi:hypothetical protein